MKNITVSVDDIVYRRARETAAARDTSVSAMVRAFLDDLAKQETDFEKSLRLESEVRARIAARGARLSADENLTRDELYDRTLR